MSFTVMLVRACALAFVLSFLLGLGWLLVFAPGV